jgi:hypothetical protein
MADVEMEPSASSSSSKLASPPPPPPPSKRKAGGQLEPSLERKLSTRFKMSQVAEFAASHSMVDWGVAELVPSSSQDIVIVEEKAAPEKKRKVELKKKRKPDFVLFLLASPSSKLASRLTGDRLGISYSYTCQTPRSQVLPPSETNPFALIREHLDAQRQVPSLPSSSSRKGN